MFSRIRHRTSLVPLRYDWTLTTQLSRVGVPPYCTSRVDKLYSPVSTLYVGDSQDNTISDTGRTGHVKHPRCATRNPLIPRPTKPVNQTKVHIHPRLENVYFEHSTGFTSPCADNVTTLEQAIPAAWICKEFGYENVRDSLLSAIGNMATYTFSRPDWFSVVDQFNESIDSLISEKFFSGEFLSESGIFGDAIQLVLNPKKALKHFFRNVIDSGLKHQTLGHIDNYFRGSNRLKLLSNRDLKSGLDAIPASLKDIVNAHLFYKFGVRPAIRDLISALDVHSRVLKRMEYLVAHEGDYVPIRVRRVIPVSFDGGYTVTPYVGVALRQSAQHTIVNLFAMGRVRSGINEMSGFRAYAEYFGLNKVVGTAWELIPFTFVFDWFTNAQERINELTRIRLGEGTFYNLVGLGHSTRDVVEKQMLITPGYNISRGLTLTSTDQPIVAYDIVGSIYNRSPGIPDTSGVVDISALGSFQGVTGSELLLQKAI